ncbi:zinc knuckle CX2CX4HX4C containing protein, partial [Tanacetum coccineum]
MNNSESVEGAKVVIPLAALEEVSNRFENTLYGYFIGQRLAFPLVENYVKNAWAKYGLECFMLKKGFFFFQFETREGMEKVLENGPWLIRLVPIFLNIWTPNTRLTNETITSAPIWVKMHNVPIVAYSETGLSLITSQLGRPIMLDAYISTMCKQSQLGWPILLLFLFLTRQDVDCPKRVKEPVANQVEDDGFTKVNRKNGKKKQNDVKQVA